MACDAILIRQAKIGMITLRGDLAGSKLKSAVKSVTGLSVPKVNSVDFDGATGVCWMSPDELLLVLSYDDVPGALDTLKDALEGQHHLAVDVSDARVVFTLDGPDAREVLAKLSPADLAPGAFGPGDIRRTRLGQVAAGMWMTGEESVTIVCFRSFGDYLELLLRTSIEAGPVGFH
jgi:sarcosine oxidase subunit gamma